jgi:hypothetical protein
VTVESLEPGLTKADKRVLALVSKCGAHEWDRREIGQAVSLWQIAEALNTCDLPDLRLTLSGLEHLGYVRSSHSVSRNRVVWWRSRKGDEAVT